MGRKTTEQFILEARKVHGNRYDYSKTKYIDAHTKIKIICKKHTIFEQSPNSHLRGAICLKCSYEERAIAIASTTEKFIKKAKKIHGDKYDYSLVKYVNNSTKIKIICPNHNIFLQRPQGHLNGKGCKKCSNEERGINSSMNTKEFISRAREIHGNEFDYSQTIYINARSKVSILCPNHGLFRQAAGSHLSGCKCPKCAGKNKTTEEWIKDFREIHGDKYDYSLTRYQRSNKKVLIKCSSHGIFKQTPHDHLQGSGCILCGRESTTEKQTGNIKTFIKKARMIHGDKYKYHKSIYKTARIKIEIICPDHGSYFQLPDSHLRGAGCPKCTGRNKTTEEIIEEFKSIHGLLYDYSKVEYKTSSDHIIITCKKHNHEFSITPSNHLKDRGCVICGRERTGKSRQGTKEEFIEKAVKVWGNKRDFTESVYDKARKKMKIRCAVHDIVFKQSPDNCLRGKVGCPECKNKFSSNLERLTEKYLKKYRIKYEKEKKFKKCVFITNLRFDFYLPDYNIAIECQGRQHYEAVEYFGGHAGFINRNIRDMIKVNFCEREGIKLIEIPYYDMTNQKIREYIESIITTY